MLEEQYDVYLAENADQAFTLMASETFDLVLTDLLMPGKSGLKVIDKALALKNRPPVIMMTMMETKPSAVEAMKRGAYDFLTAGESWKSWRSSWKRALESKSLQTEVVPPRAIDLQIQLRGDYRQLQGAGKRLSRG